MKETDEVKDKDDGVRDGIILSAEDHIKIIDKESGKTLLDKRG